MKNGKHPISKKILPISLCLLAVIYLGYHLARGLRTDAQFYAVRPYTAYDSQVFTGYIFKDETPLFSGASGMCNYHYYDGEKVAANRVVADVYGAENQVISQRIAEVKKQIEILRASMSLGKLTLTEVNRKIELVSYEITQKNAAGDAAAANALGDDLLVLMAKKDLLSSGKDDYNEEIAALESQKDALVASLGLPLESVSAPGSGYFYSGTDGYEEIFTAQTAKNLSLALYDQITSVKAVKKPNAVGTLVTSSQWYYAAKVPEADAEGFLVGTTYECFFPDNSHTEAIFMKLVSKETAASQTLLVFYSSSLPRGFDTTRTQRMQANRGSYTGFRIPAEVVRAENGKTFVYVFYEGVAEKREVSILWEQNGYYIISSENTAPGMLKLNDLIILNDTKLYENKFID
ncbi:MAG: hypothetical protein IJD59_08565 [Clostridia bacterium]|nr:hypothetical protein [Clostridia bacterium]